MKRSSALLSLILLSITALWAGAAPPPPPPPPLGIPVDAGSIVLVVSGALLGGYQVYKRVTTKKTDNGIS